MQDKQGDLQSMLCFQDSGTRRGHCVSFAVGEGSFANFQTSLMPHLLNTARTWTSLCQFSGKCTGWGWGPPLPLQDIQFIILHFGLHGTILCVVSSPGGSWEACRGKMLTWLVNMFLKVLRITFRAEHAKHTLGHRATLQPRIFVLNVECGGKLGT